MREIFFLGREKLVLPVAYENSQSPVSIFHSKSLCLLTYGLPHPYSTLLVCIFCLGHFLQWQLYMQWRQWAQTEQQPGDSAIVKTWGKEQLTIRDLDRGQILASLPMYLRSQGHVDRSLGCYSARRLLVTRKTQSSGFHEVTGSKPQQEEAFLESFIAPYF